MISDALFINHLLPILIFKIYYFSQINRMWMCKYEWMVEWIIPVLTYAILYLHLPFDYTHFLTHNVYEWMGNIPSVHPFCWICAGDVLELFELRNVIINLIIAALHTLNCNYFQRLRIKLFKFISGHSVIKVYIRFVCVNFLRNSHHFISLSELGGCHCTLSLPLCRFIVYFNSCKKIHKILIKKR